MNRKKMPWTVWIRTWPAPPLKNIQSETDFLTGWLPLSTLATFILFRLRICSSTMGNPTPFHTYPILLLTIFRFFGIGATICTRQEIECLPYVGFLQISKFPISNQFNKNLERLYIWGVVRHCLSLFVVRVYALTRDVKINRRCSRDGRKKIKVRPGQC